jgi:hypothetical protein
MSTTSKLSSPFSTGGGGVHFEAHVQASFVTLMLTGGYAPCLPCWPITEIKLQGKIAGFDTDDFIVTVEDPVSKERRRLLGQVKRSISVTRSSKVFGEVMQAAWNDYQNPSAFTKGKDALALITASISTVDERSVRFLLGQARHTVNEQEFFRNVEQANFSPRRASDKLQVIHEHLTGANDGKPLAPSDLYQFLRHFHVLGYDLGSEVGVVLSLLHSHMSQYRMQSPEWGWSRVVDIVQTWNQDAGTITRATLPGDLQEAFKRRAVAAMPRELMADTEAAGSNLAQHPDATYLALVALVGAWDEGCDDDVTALSQLLGISYEEWLRKAREVLSMPNSPLSLKNGRWSVTNRLELWTVLGYRLLDQNLDSFKSLALSALREPDPAFELPANERYAATLYGKAFSYSRTLRRGIADGLAILGSHSGSCTNCSDGKPELTSTLAVREILSDADWVRWGSLDELLPSLGEAAPTELLNGVEQALRTEPCAFETLFAQEGQGVVGRNYLTGLLWALEGLAWEEQHLVRVCVILAELASHDPGGQWANRPSTSLTTILLPWLPHTLASVEKRHVAVQTVIGECLPEAWGLIIRLLPGQQQVSSGSHKPRWRNVVPDEWKATITRQEYWNDVSFLADLAIGVAGMDAAKLAELAALLGNLPRSAFDKLLVVLTSEAVVTLPEADRLSVWNSLTTLSNHHRRFADAEWALPSDLVARIEGVAAIIAPSDPVNLYRHLFTDRNVDLYDENGNWEEQRKRLDDRRDAALLAIFHQTGLTGALRFGELVASPEQVGYALAGITDSIEKTLLPAYLGVADGKHSALIAGFIKRRYLQQGWDWCDAVDKQSWSPEQVGWFLVWLPFERGAWDRASEWLKEDEVEYWSRTGANAYQTDVDLVLAVEKLLEYARPHAAINCLVRMRHANQAVHIDQCVRALIDAVSLPDSTSATDAYHTIDLIKYLQSESSVAHQDMIKIEWSYLPLLGGDKKASPRCLEYNLASDPGFFCEVLRLLYRSSNAEQQVEEPTEATRAMAHNAWRLFHEWQTPPGTQADGTFNAEHFERWLERVKELCVESGHLEVALITIGEVLIHAPPDPGGLWIHRAVAGALNDRDDQHLRKGFGTGILNSRGAHWVDPTGKPERELAEQFRRKGEEVENSGFQRLAVTMRKVADAYDREAAQIIAEHKQEVSES